MGRASNPTRGFGGFVRKLRTDQGLTLAQVGERAGLTGSYLNRVELGQAKPTADAVSRLADALGTSVAVLLERLGHMPPEISAALSETPEELLWFASLSASARRSIAKQHGSSVDEARAERARLRRIAARLADP